MKRHYVLARAKHWCHTDSGPRSVKMKKLLLALGALVVAGTVGALASGYFPGWPIVGSAANSTCVNYFNGSCAQYAPAGPPTLTGAETVPADTNVASGGGPATVLITTCQFGAGSKDILSPPNGTTTETIPNQVCWYVVSGTSGTLSSLTLTLPNAPLDGQILHISIPSTTVTTLSISAPSGFSVVGAPTSNTPPGASTYIYNAANTTWYRS
jgi:hypothetical protein